MSTARPYFLADEVPPPCRSGSGDGAAGLDPLRFSAVYCGTGVPHGAGAPVLLVPGFLASDWYLLEMFHWLRRIGYRPYLSRIGRNADCLDVLVGRLFETIEGARAETGRPVHLIGHSLGGMLARSVALRRPAAVASVITLGSPFRGIRPHPLVLQATVVRSRTQRQRQRPDCFPPRAGCRDRRLDAGGASGRDPAARRVHTERRDPSTGGCA